MSLHLIKLCVGCDTVEELAAWRARHVPVGTPWTMRTRQTPKRAVELLDGGSLYWVFKGQVLCRQSILAVDTVGEGVTARCELTLSPELVRTAPMPRRAFQGWRYLAAADAPPDLTLEGGDEIPSELARKLREAGAW